MRTRPRNDHSVYRIGSRTGIAAHGAPRAGAGTVALRLPDRAECAPPGREGGGAHRRPHRIGPATPASPRSGRLH